MSMTENLDNPTTQTLNAASVWVLALCWGIAPVDVELAKEALPALSH